MPMPPSIDEMKILSLQTANGYPIYLPNLATSLTPNGNHGEGHADSFTVATALDSVKVCPIAPVLTDTTRRLAYGVSNIIALNGRFEREGDDDSGFTLDTMKEDLDAVMDCISMEVHMKKKKLLDGGASEGTIHSQQPFALHNAAIDELMIVYSHHQLHDQLSHRFVFTMPSDNAAIARGKVLRDILFRIGNEDDESGRFEGYAEEAQGLLQHVKAGRDDNIRAVNEGFSKNSGLANLVKDLLAEGRGGTRARRSA